MPTPPTMDLIEIGGGARPIPVQIYQGVVARPAPLVLHLPGGTFVDIPDERPVGALLAEAGAVVVSAAYPVGAAHPFPEAVEAMYGLLCNLRDRRSYWAARASKLFVAGEEAGGTLAAALAMMARDRLGPPVAGQVLLSPMLDAGMATCSIRDRAAGPVGCKWADGWATYLGVPDKAAHPYAAPSSGSRLHGLPPALVVTTTDDPMRDEALDYARRLKQAGVPLQVRALKADDWPDALSRPAAPDWAAQLRTAFAEFFAAVTPNLVPAEAAARS
ncbi:MAG: alpha/beta hydrolase [Acetobacteraceae bacterium]